MNFLSNENITLISKVISQTTKISREQINTSMNEYYKNNNINSFLTKNELINTNKAIIQRRLFLFENNVFHLF
jgi:hypothetical protein